MQATSSRLASGAARAWLLALFLLLLGVAEAVSCPGCYYQRRLDVWPVIIVVKLVAAILFTCNRLDPVRVFYSFAPYAVFYPQIEMTFIERAFPGASHPFVARLVELNLIQVNLHLPDALLLYALGMLGFYRRNKEKGLPVWQAAAYALSMFVLLPTVLV
jgi:hypothetical protein